MTAKTEILDQIRRAFSIWSSDLKQSSKVNRLADNISSEDIAAGLLNLIYGYDLKNANEIHPNHKAVDLLDTDAEDGGGVAVQISTSNTRQKALKTMKGFCDGSSGDPLSDEYSKLIFLILTTDDKFSGWDGLGGEGYTLKILNLTDLSKEIEHLELSELEAILEHLNRELCLETAGAEQPRDRISRIAHILDADAIRKAEKEFTEADAEKFYMVDLNFPRMLKVVSKGQDIAHDEMNDRLTALCNSGNPAILTGYSGTGKSTIMLRAAVNWVRSGGIALWISPEEDTTLTEAEAAQFYKDVRSIIPAGQQALLCLDNPSRWSSAFRGLAGSWQEDPQLRLLLAERTNRLSRMTDANGDLLHHWFDGASVVALMQENERNPLRVKDYPVEYIPEDYLRKQEILKRAVAVMMRKGDVKKVSERDAVKQIMHDYHRGNVSLVELIYRAQFWLRDHATKPEQLRMDWDEWKQILRKELGIKKSAQQLYGVIALCNLFEVPVSISLFCRHFDVTECDLVEAMNNWRMQKNVEPVIFREGSRTLLPKHDVAAELFFLFHRDTLPVNELMVELLNTMDEFEIEAFLEKIVRKGAISKGYQFPIGKIRYRDYLLTIYKRSQAGTCGLGNEGKARLALGLLYAVPKKDRRLGEQTIPMVEKLDPVLDGTVLTAALYTEWGRLLADLNRKRDAEEKFRSVIAADPKQVHSRTELGRLLAKQPGRENEAELFLREAIRIDPKNLHPHTELGRLLAKQPGRENEAEKFLREILGFDPNNIQARTELGRLLAKQPGRENEAEHFLREAIRIDPKNLHPRIELAKICIRNDQYTEAERLYREVLRLDPGNRYAREGLKHLLQTASPTP